jgi:hypothetical protein
MLREPEPRQVENRAGRCADDGGAVLASSAEFEPSLPGGGVAWGGRADGHGAESSRESEKRGGSGDALHFTVGSGGGGSGARAIPGAQGRSRALPTPPPQGNFNRVSGNRPVRNQPPASATHFRI